jgi:esterase/lipase superfamily enzyme
MLANQLAVLLVTVLGLIAVQEPAPPQLVTQVTIIGTFRFQSGSESPGGVTVTLYDARIRFSEDLMDATGRDPNAVAETTTDNDGRYRLTAANVPAGDGFSLVFRRKPRQVGVLPLTISAADDGRTITRDFVSTSEVAGVSSEDQIATVQVHFATDREPGPAAGRFKNARAGDGRLRHGAVTVTIPPTHRKGNLELPPWWSLRDAPDPMRAFTVVRRAALRREAFLSALQAAARSPEPEPRVLLFIHGYNVSFDEAVFRSAQMGFDLRFAGAVATYTWPSKEHVYSYSHDRTTIDWSAPHLAAFLADLGKSAPRLRLFIVAHSMGADLLTRALRDVPAGMKNRIHELVLAAPDIDAGVFEQLAQEITSKSRHATLYASSRDMALVASKLFNGGRRAGDSSPLTLVDGVDAIDASAVPLTDLLGHSLFGDSVPMLDDLFYMFSQGLAPAERAGLEPRAMNGKRYWAFVD